MTKRKLKLGFAPTGNGGPGHGTRWLDPEIPLDASVNIDWYIDIVRKAEAAKFDFVFVVDSQYITRDSPPHYLNRLEPFTLLSALAVTTRNIGLIGTATTSFNAPFNLARRFASLDLISRGRAGWNVVTSGDAGAAGNFGLDEHYDYDTRYGRAVEYLDVVRGLWRSYEDDAFERNRETGVFLNPDKQHALNHKGKYFSVAGALNIERSPQGEPLIFQAGDSEQGRDLGAQKADAIFTHAANIEAGKAFYRDIAQRAAKAGRNPDDILIFPGVSPIVGDNDKHALELQDYYNRADSNFDLRLAEFGRTFGWHDFRQYDLDAPFPVQALEFARNSFFTGAQRITNLAVERGLTLRQTIETITQNRKTPFVGSPETVATEIIRWFDERAFDGLNLMVGHPEQFNRFTRDVVAVLQDRGVFRREYEDTTLRGNLELPKPANIRSAAVSNRQPVERQTSRLAS